MDPDGYQNMRLLLDVKQAEVNDARAGVDECMAEILRLRQDNTTLLEALRLAQAGSVPLRDS